MPFFYLIFGHLVADFILQPYELIRWKFRGWQGIMFHAVLHFLIYLLVFFPYLPDFTVFLTVLAVAGAHFAIDRVKVDTERRGRRFRLYFVLDQISHLILMIAGGYVLGGLQPKFMEISYFSILYQNPLFIAGLILLLFFTYPLEIWFFQRKRESTPEVTFKPNYDAMLKRAVVFTALYGAFMIFGVYRAAAMG